MIKVDHDVYALFMAESPLHNRMLRSIITPRALPEKIGSSRVRPLEVDAAAAKASLAKASSKDMFLFSSQSSSSSKDPQFSIDKLNLQSDDKRMTMRAQSIVGVLFSRKSNADLEKWFRKIVVDDKNKQTPTNVMVFRGVSGSGKSFIVNWMSTKYGLKCITFVPGVQHHKGIIYIIDHPDSKILDHVRRYYYESKTRITIIILVDFNISLTPLVQSLVHVRKSKIKRKKKDHLLTKTKQREEEERQKEYYELVKNGNLSFSNKIMLLQLTHRMDKQQNDSINFVPSPKELQYFAQIGDDNLSRMISQFKFWLCPTMESFASGSSSQSQRLSPPSFTQIQDSNLLKSMQSLISLVNHPSIHLLLPIWSRPQETSFPKSASQLSNSLQGTSLQQQLHQFRQQQTTTDSEKKDRHFSQIAHFLSFGYTSQAFSSLISFLIHWIAQIEQINLQQNTCNSNVLRSIKEVMTIMMRQEIQEVGHRQASDNNRQRDLEMDAHVWTRGVIDQVSKHVHKALTSLTNATSNNDGKPPRLNWSQVMKSWTQFFRLSSTRQETRIDHQPTVDELYHGFPT